MLCPKCNTENTDANTFCNECGTRLVDDTAEAVIEEIVTEENISEEPVAPKKSAVDIVKKFASSKLFLFATLGLTLSLVINFVYALYTCISSIPTIIEWLPYLEDPYMLEGFITSLSASLGTSIGLLGALPIGLVSVIALWMVFKAGKSKADGMKTGGLTTTKVVYIISLIVGLIACVVGIVGTVCMIIAGAGTAIAGESEVGIPLIIGGIACTVLMLAVIAYIIVLYIFIFKSLKAAITTCRTGVPSYKVSRFVGVMCFFNALSALSAPASFIAAPLSSISAGAPVSVLISAIPSIIYGSLVGVCAVVTNICFGIIIFKYRAAMKEFIRTQVTNN